MKKVKINSQWFEVTLIKNRLGAVAYKGKECQICFAIEGYYIEYGKKIIRIEETV